MNWDASIEVATDGQTMTVGLYEGGGADIIDVAWQAPGCTDDMFLWLAQSLANYHHIPMHRGDGVPGTVPVATDPVATDIVIDGGGP